MTLELVASNDLFDTMEETPTTVRCIEAATQFYKVGTRYTVYKLRDGDDKKRFVKGSDGIYDQIGMTVSKFKDDTK